MSRLRRLLYDYDYDTSVIHAIPLGDNFWFYKILKINTNKFSPLTGKDETHFQR